jgi:glycosyltransferase involved in cell wall biosynthesis
VLVMPAYNAADTLRQTWGDIPDGFVDEHILVDDASRDETVTIARSLGIRVL